MSDREVADELVRKDRAAIGELQAFLDAVRACGFERIAGLLQQRADQLSSAAEVDQRTIEALEAGLRRWELSLGLPSRSSLGDEDEASLSSQVTPTFRDELLNMIATLLEGSAAQANSFILQKGLAGAPRLKLDAIGQDGTRYGFAKPEVTRQAVQSARRLAEKKLRRKADGVRFLHWEPAAEQAQSELPGSLTTFLGLFGYEEVADPAGLFEALKEVAGLFGLDFPFQLENLGAGDHMVFVADKEVDDWVSALADVSGGAYTAFQVAVETLGCTERWLRRTIVSSGKLEFLDPGQHYFWRRPNLPPRNFGHTMNSVLTSLCKVFSATDHAEAAELAVSVGRDRMLRRDGPARVLPVEVVEGIARRSGLFNVQGGRIERKPDVERWCVISDRDLRLLSVGAKLGPVVSSKDLYPGLEAEGLTPGNANQVIAFSPFLIHSEAGVGESEGIYRFVLDPRRIDLDSLARTSEEHGGAGLSG